MDLLPSIVGSGISLPLEDGPACVEILRPLVIEAPQDTYALANEPHISLLKDHVAGLDPGHGGLGAYLPLQPLAQKALQGSIRAYDYFDLYHLALAINFARGLAGATAQLVGSHQVYPHVSCEGEKEHSPIAQCALPSGHPSYHGTSTFPFGGKFSRQEVSFWERLGVFGIFREINSFFGLTIFPTGNGH